MASLTAAFLALSFGERAVVCAFATLLINLSAAQCTLCMVSRRASAAASYGVVVILLGAVNVVGYSSDSRLLGPIVLAGWIGTFIAVRRAAPSFAPGGAPALGGIISGPVNTRLSEGGALQPGTTSRLLVWDTFRIKVMHRIAGGFELPAFRVKHRLR